MSVYNFGGKQNTTQTGKVASTKPATSGTFNFGNGGSSNGVSQIDYSKYNGASQTELVSQPQKQKTSLISKGKDLFSSIFGKVKREGKLLGEAFKDVPSQFQSTKGVVTSGIVQIRQGFYDREKAYLEDKQKKNGKLSVWDQSRLSENERYKKPTEKFKASAKKDLEESSAFQKKHREQVQKDF